MKPYIQDVINRANLVTEGHNEMVLSSIAQEHDDLKAKLVVFEAELIQREDECESDSDDLSEAIKAVGRVSDVREYHHGSLATM